MGRFERLLGLLLLLRSGERLTVAAVASRFEVSSRTIHRDVDLLSTLGVPVWFERGRRGGVRLLPGFFLPPIMFTTGEATSLLAGLALLGRLRVVPYATELQSARLKLLAALPDRHRENLSGVDRIVGFESPAPDTLRPGVDRDELPPSRTAIEREGAVLTAFLDARFAGQHVRLRYRSPYQTADVTGTFRPLGTFWDRDRWYLVVERVPAGGQRTLRADRVRDIRTEGKPPESVPPAFDIRDLLNHRWLRDAMARWAKEAPARLRITAEQQALLSRDWYYGQARFDPEPDGAFLMTWGEDDGAQVEALCRWLGAGAEVLEAPGKQA